MNLAEVWPLFGLTLSTRRLVLRTCTEADLGTLVSIRPPDAEQDPRLPRHVSDEAATRAHRVLQSYWQSMGTWTAESWRLDFVVRADGELIGVQTLEGEDFPRRRAVETSSWLVEARRGQGLGKEMRSGVLELAFGPLAAKVAETEAWHDNAASLGVSVALGYVPNGETVHPRGDGSDRMIRMRLPREDWMPAASTEVTGFEPCRALFGA